MNNKDRIFPVDLSKKQISDAGMAFALLLVIIGFLLHNELFFKLLIPALIINILIPKFFYPFAVFWYGLANILSNTVSKILLSIVYFVVVMPMGLLRRLFGKDSLFLKKFKRDRSSVLIERNYTFSAKDIKNPF